MSSEKGEGPQDKWGAVWFGCLLLGVGVLLPWNALISSVGYFSEMLCIGLDQSECFADVKSQQFAFYLSIAYNIPSIPLLLLSTVFAERISFKTRIIACFAGEFIVFVLVCVVVSLSLPLTTPILTENDAFWAMLVLTFFSGCFSALLFGAILSFTALFPPNYTTAVMSGNGIAGIIAGLLRVITLAALPDTDSGSKTSSLIFFGITTTIFGVCIASFISMLKNSFVVHHIGTSLPKPTSGQGETELLMSHAGTSTKNMNDEVSAWEVQKKIWVPSLSVFSVFFITLSLFPGMIYDICPSSTGKIQNVEWFGVLLVGLFQVFDFVGRTLPRWTELGLTSRILPIPILLRALFFLLFIFCIKPKYFESDWWPCIWMVLFATTNGFTGTLAMMFGPTLVEERERPKAGYIMSFYLNTGIFAGVMFALAVNAWVKAPACPN